MIEISIIIPVYNKEQYIVRCFDSIVNQIQGQEDLYEILVIDDGSTDNSATIIDEYARRYSCFTVISQQNSGVSVARNVGIERAKGEYVLFLDADDELLQGALSNTSSFLMQNGTIDLLVTRRIKVDVNGNTIIRKPSLKEKISYNGIEAYREKYVKTNAGGGICRTNFLRQNNICFPNGIVNGEDTIFMGLVSVYAKSIVFLDIALYRIYVIKNSASTTNETILALNHVNTVNYFCSVRGKIKCTKEQKGILEYVMYQLLSNTIYHFLRSKELRYKDFRDKVHVQEILPIDTRYMYKMRTKAKLMNFSVAIFYCLAWIKNFVTSFCR